MKASKQLRSLALGLVLPVILSGCSTAVGVGQGPKIASDSHYRSGNMKPYTVRGKTYKPAIPQDGYSQTGQASWYGNESGIRTADGEVYNADGISAAHRTFPLPSIAEVTNLDNGKSIRVRVNDRGPFNDRIIDLSCGAAKQIGVYQTGTARVRVTWLGPADAVDNGAAAKSSSQDGRYIVQLGAFSKKSNAEAALARLDDTHSDKRDDLYIVYLGPYDSAAQAETHRQDAIDAGFNSAILKRQD